LASPAAWAEEARRSAERSLATLPPLTGREEEWRFTPPRDLALAGTEPEAPAAGAPAELPSLASGPRAARLEIVDGKLAGGVSAPVGLPDGIVVADLGDALSSHEELLRERLYSFVGFDTRPGALNAVHWESGVFVHVPRGAALELPVEALHAASGARGRVAGRSLVVVDEGGRLTLVERFANPAGPVGGVVQASSVAEVFVGPGARVDHYSFIGWDGGMRHHAMLVARVDRDASFRSMVVTLGGDVVRVEPTLVCAGPGADAQALGLYFAAGTQHFEHRVVARHEAPHAHSNLLYKGAIQDTAHTIFYGNLVVQPGAPGTDAYQTNRNLVLNEGARADTIPFLEIETADVRCSHAGAVGRMDDEQLFYLRSRGVPEEVAKKLIVFGFFQEVLEQFGLEDLRRELESAVGAKIR